MSVSANSHPGDLWERQAVARRAGWGNRKEGAHNPLLRAYLALVGVSAGVVLVCCWLYAPGGWHPLVRALAMAALLGCGHAILAAAVLARAVVTLSGHPEIWVWAFWGALAPYLLGLSAAALRVVPARPALGLLVFSIPCCNIAVGVAMQAARVVTLRA